MEIENDDDFDPDIAAMSQLNAWEKNGLQMYRNYTRSFAEHREKEFAASINKLTFDVEALKGVVDLIGREDARFLSVIACAFADDQLHEMFRRSIPDNVPNRKQLLSRVGPLSSLFHRIQFAYAFDLISADLLDSLDALRKVRNEISHGWKLSTLDEFLGATPTEALFAVEDMFRQHEKSDGRFDEMEAHETFRVRLMWLLARIFYETLLYNRSREWRLEPRPALYGPRHPELLSQVAGVAKNACYLLMERNAGPKTSPDL